MLHCVNENDPALDKNDKIYKARPVFNRLLKILKHYYVPKCETSLDEEMIPTKNKLSFRQYIKDKPKCCGIKTFLLCNSENGYILNAEVYTGRGQNYTTFTNRFYTSVQLTEYLLNSHDIRLCGTAMTKSP